MRDEYFEEIKIKGYSKKKGIKKEKTSTFDDIDFKKSLGQNFISDKNLLNSIADIAEVSKNDSVLEIGAGAGTLTAVLATRAKEVISFEIDKNLQPVLEKVSSLYKNLDLRFMDFMQADIANLFKGKYKVVANIPYYITTPIIFKLLNFKDEISLMLFMVQKEVAERFASKEGNKMYGITSVILQAIADVSYEKTVKKECFTPHPKVDSALIKIKFHNKYKFENFENFKTFIHASFAMRRKTLINNLMAKLNLNREDLMKIFDKLGFAYTVRPEDLSVDQFVKLYNNL